MTRLLGASLFSLLLLANNLRGQASPQSPAHGTQSEKAKPAPQDETGPPEEDESLAPEKIPFDPMAADRSIRVGDYYMHKGNARAALKRYELASKYNPSSPDAFFRIGEAEEKLKDPDAAHVAFEKVIRLAPNTKLAEEAHKKLKKKS